MVRILDQVWARWSHDIRSRPHRESLRSRRRRSVLGFSSNLSASATLVEKHVRKRKKKAGLAGARRGKEAAALDAAGATLGSLGLVAFVTPDLPKKPRRDEILAWLSKHPEVNRYVVIDDEDDELDGLPLFQPSCHIGLTDEIVAGVESYLAGETDKEMRRSRLKRIFQNCYAILRGHPG